MIIMCIQFITRNSSEEMTPCSMSGITVYGRVKELRKGIWKRP